MHVASLLCPVQVYYTGPQFIYIQAYHTERLLAAEGVPHIIGYVIDLLFSVTNDISVGSLQCEEARIKPQDSPHSAGQLLYLRQ